MIDFFLLWDIFNSQSNMRNTSVLNPSNIKKTTHTQTDYVTKSLTASVFIFNLSSFACSGSNPLLHIYITKRNHTPAPPVSSCCLVSSFISSLGDLRASQRPFSSSSWSFVHVSCSGFIINLPFNTLVCCELCLHKTFSSTNT